MPMHFLTTHNDEVLSKKSPQALSADSSAWPTEALKIYGGKQYNIKSVTIMCHNDELGWTMSWAGCLLTD